MGTTYAMVEVDVRVFEDFITDAADELARTNRRVSVEGLAQYTGIPIDILRRCVTVTTHEDGPKP